jgi:hypothetical protein
VQNFNVQHCGSVDHPLDADNVQLAHKKIAIGHAEALLGLVMEFVI